MESKWTDIDTEWLAGIIGAIVGYLACWFWFYFNILREKIKK